MHGTFSQVPQPPSGDGIPHAARPLDVAGCPACVVAGDETVPDGDGAGEVVGAGDTRRALR